MRVFFLFDPKLSDLALNRLKKGKSFWRAELTSVAIDADELRLGVKGQSNLEIAGSPRNLLR